jgi:macrodomain Ter protein organizer (MatP/YcbG family)
MTLSANVTNVTNAIGTNTKRKSLSLNEKTYNRLAKFGHWSESADDLINRILDEREGKENISEVPSKDAVP